MIRYITMFILNVLSGVLILFPTSHKIALICMVDKKWIWEYELEELLSRSDDYDQGDI